MVGKMSVFFANSIGCYTYLLPMNGEIVLPEDDVVTQYGLLENSIIWWNLAGWLN